MRRANLPKKQVQRLLMYEALKRMEDRTERRRTVKSDCKLTSGIFWYFDCYPAQLRFERERRRTGRRGVSDSKVVDPTNVKVLQ